MRHHSPVPLTIAEITELFYVEVSFSQSREIERVERIINRTVAA